MQPRMATNLHASEYSDELPTCNCASLKDVEAKEADRSSLDHVEIPLEPTSPAAGGGSMPHAASGAHQERESSSLSALVPSFLQRTTDPSSPKRLHPTAWLDGVRGVAALFVVFHHATLMWFSWDVHAGWAPGMGQSWPRQFFKLPIIRLTISGPPQVALFFVVSGYAISYKPLKLIRQGRFAEAGESLCSSVFRRHTRLFMPAVIITFFCALATQIDEGWYPDSSVGRQGAVIPALPPPHRSSLADQLSDWAATQMAFVDPIKNGLVQGESLTVVENPYDPPLWTLPVEFCSSIIVFTFLVAFTRVHSRVRMGAALFVAVYVQYYTFWAVFTFLGGMLICDLHFEIEEMLSKCADGSGSGYDGSLPLWARAHQDLVTRVTSRLTRSHGTSLLVRRICGIAAFILALMVLSVPSFRLGAQYSLGYGTITSWAPLRFGDRFLVPLGAIMTVLVLDLVPFLQILFSNPFCQYLGRISFALYLIHGPLLWSLGLKLTNFFIDLTGGTSGSAFILAIFLTSCFWLVIAIYLADLTATYIDQPTLRFTKWAYGKLLKRVSQQEA